MRLHYPAELLVLGLVLVLAVAVVEAVPCWVSAFGWMQSTLQSCNFRMNLALLRPEGKSARQGRYRALLQGRMAARPDGTWRYLNLSQAQPLPLGRGSRNRALLV